MPTVAEDVDATAARPAVKAVELLMWASFGWGTLAASTLVIGAVLAIVFRISVRWIGLITAFGVGVLISAVAFDLVEEAANTATANRSVYLGIFAGCGVFFGGDWLIDRSGGGQRKDRQAPRRTVPRLPSCSDPCSTGFRSRWSSASRSTRGERSAPPT